MVKHVLAALLLMVQLQPLFGSAACLGLTGRASQSECPMPEHGAMPLSTVGQTEAPAPTCELASVCAPSSLAILSLPGSLESLVAVQSAQPTTASPSFFGVSSAPPFHPPRA
jgi:hypothetical protein